MHQRPMWKRLAATAVVLALASPVWASEMQMKKKEDPKAEQKQDATQKAKQDPAKDSEKDADQQTPKKNCPNDIMSFNTLEDMYGFLGTVDSLTLQQAQPAQVQAATGTATAAPAVEWRAVEKSDKTNDEAKKKAE